MHHAFSFFLDYLCKVMESYIAVCNLAVLAETCYGFPQPFHANAGM